MINLIPLPKDMTEETSVFSFNLKDATISISEELSEIEEMIPIVLKHSFEKIGCDGSISLIFDPLEAKEGYSLIITRKCAKAYASSYEGAFYALQTMRQLFCADLENKNIMSSPCVTIRHDSPLYSWRGLQLDESRHFFGKETVKLLLDFMAMYKLNVFHWHLTDDQGWRIESKKYPLLTKVGSVRKGTQLKNWTSNKIDYTEYKGFYSQQDIKEIVDYAKKRCINIVPEIDFPAHCAAVIASYNELACRDIPSEVHYFFGGKIPLANGNKNWNRTLCLGKDEVYRFVFDIIDEVCGLFPFEYFHIGGDEAPTDEWKKCPQCQKKIKENGLKNEVALQGYFTNKVNEHLKSNGKTLIGWNEILASDTIDHDVVAQYWTPKSDKNVTEHMKKNGKIILSCHKNFYFDMFYSYCTPKLTYNFYPTKHNVPADLVKNVLGVEGELWSEWIDSRDMLFFKLFNRGLALAETGWTDISKKNYNSFVERMEKQKQFMDAMGIYYGPDFITMKPNRIKKSKIAKKFDFSMKDFDVEYKISKLYKPE